ncbi:MAG: hypothetical protein FWC79_00535 [Oscillospiraceae bacterium]|nr:hypothetical protein [Oscillospiraceae bacterium]
MLKEKVNSLKAIFNKKTEGNNKRNIENLVVFLVLLIVTVIAINTIWGSSEEEVEVEEGEMDYVRLVEDTDRQINRNINSNISINDTYNLENNLRDILSRIAGAGEVDVLITYSETSEVVPMYNETRSVSSTDEVDSAGGTRSVRTNRYKKRNNIRTKKRSKCSGDGKSYTS